MEENTTSTMKKIDRFDKYMKYKGLNDNKATVQLGLSVGTLGKSRKESRDLSDKVVEQILNFYTDLSRVWLLTGEGEMLNAKVIQNNESGDNINGHSVTVNKTEKDYLEIIKKQSDQLSKSQEQIDRLLSIIENFGK